MWEYDNDLFNIVIVEINTEKKLLEFYEMLNLKNIIIFLGS